MKKPPAKKVTTRNDRTTGQETILVDEHSSVWSGPLPPPQTLAEFDEIVRDGAERIMTAWEKETEHRQKLERQEM